MSFISIVIRWFQDRELKSRAREHAKFGGNLVEQEVLARLGPRPGWDPNNNLEHGHIAHDLHNRAEIEELEEDLRHEEDEMSHHPSPGALNASLVFLFCAEFVGSSLVARALGLENPEKSIVAALLACFAFFVTFVTVRSALGTSPRPGEVPRRSPWFSLFVVVYAAFVVSVAILRVDETSASEGSSTGVDLASAAVMLFATVGPAAVAESTMRRRAPAAFHTKEIRKLRRRLKEARRAHSRAQNYVDAVARQEAWWDYESGRLRALYEREFRSVRARLTPQPTGATLGQISASGQPAGADRVFLLSKGGSSDEHRRSK